MRDVRSILAYAKDIQKKTKEAMLNKLMRREVDTGANGTQKYVIKQGVNAGKVTGDKFQ
jgi:hypothetical protein|tara:strand:- start:1261 stop:1437 length:177 start_codon:yes stop_codon:yes gene_type:complete